MAQRRAALAPPDRSGTGLTEAGYRNHFPGFAFSRSMRKSADTLYFACALPGYTRTHSTFAAFNFSSRIMPSSAECVGSSWSSPFTGGFFCDGYSRNTGGSSFETCVIGEYSSIHGSNFSRWSKNAGNAPSRLVGVRMPNAWPP